VNSIALRFIRVPSGREVLRLLLCQQFLDDISGGLVFGFRKTFLEQR
jgi:hypothetical protein